MKKFFTLMALTLTFGSAATMAQEQELKEKTPAFPGAEGYGRYVTGGRGGKVYHVTNLNDSGEGSFRWACQQSGPRTIVFDVCGTIHLKSQLKLSSGNVTIAGQTAPGEGICVADWDFTISAPNVIVRYMRFRCSDTSGGEPDGLGGMDGSRVIVDHCSVSWSVDECCSVYGNEHMTVQWCLISQSLRNSTHSKSAHGYGGNWGGKGATYHHNLLAHHDSRTPRFGNRPKYNQQDTTDYRCNVIYNWAGNGCYGGEGMKVNMVNNYYKPGPATDGRGSGNRRALHYRICGIGVSNSETDGSYHKWGKYYVNGNINPDHPNLATRNWEMGIYAQIADNTWGFDETTRDTMRLSEPLPFMRVTTHTAEQAYEKVLKYAGCCIQRDWVDELMISDTENREATYTGVLGTDDYPDWPGIIDTPYDMRPEDADDSWSPWPELKKTRSYIDNDGDGMDDTWEDWNGLDNDDPTDGNIVNADGYTNLEHYLNSLVARITADQNEGGVEEGFVEYVNPMEGTIAMPVENIDLTEGEITMADDGRKRATIKDGKADSFSNNDHLTFALYNRTEGIYTISFGAATTRSDFKLNVRLTDDDTKAVEADQTFTISNTGNWQAYEDYTFDTGNVTKGRKTLDLTFISSKGQYTGNLKDLSIRLKETTDMQSVLSPMTATADAAVYDLQGRQLSNSKWLNSQLKPGIYVKGGRKVVVGK